MRSSFTALALALAFVTVTALPAMAFTLSENPAGGDGVGITTPDNSEPGMEIFLKIEGVDGESESAPSSPGGALPAPNIDEALLGEPPGWLSGEGKVLLPAVQQAAPAIQAMPPTQGIREQKVRNLQAAPAIQAMPSTQGIQAQKCCDGTGNQGQKVAPIAKSLRAVQ